MNAEAIVHRAKQLGVTLTLAGDSIRYVPKSAAPPDLITTLRKHKPEVLAYLRKNLGAPPGSETHRLLTWASRLAVKDLVLPEPITYVEVPLRSIRTERVSRYAAQYLTTVSLSHLAQRAGGWGPWTPEWWKRREDEALCALRALRNALDAAQVDSSN